MPTREGIAHHQHGVGTGHQRERSDRERVGVEALQVERFGSPPRNREDVAGGAFVELSVGDRDERERSDSRAQ